MRRPVFAAVLVAHLAAGCADAPVPEGRSLVLVSLDTTRADHLAMYGYPVVTTPRLEELARRGVVYEEILAVTGEIDADLVVLTTHGRSGIPHLVLGSVAEKIVRMAPVPVATLPRK